jgi:uncharacterized membrane protein YeaQ/YmgE (transglycosylase-associated protein family)
VRGSLAVTLFFVEHPLQPRERPRIMLHLRTWFWSNSAFLAVTFRCWHERALPEGHAANSCRDEHLIIQIITGVVGGHAAGAMLKNYTLGVIGNTIAGAIGGAVGGQLLQQLVPALASAASNVDIGALIGQVVGGGVGGAILTVLAGVTKWIVVPPKST